MEQNKLKCEKCGYQWKPRKIKPVECPECKNRKYWEKRKEE